MESYTQKRKWTKITDETNNSPCNKCCDSERERYSRPYTFRGVTKNLIVCISCLQEGILRH